MIKIAIIGLQGGFIEHLNILEKNSAIFPSEVVLIKNGEDWDRHAYFGGIIIPGGESTVIRKLAQQHGIWDRLLKWVEDDMPIWGTCAGLILLSSKIEDSNNTGDTLNALSISVLRNGYGRQSKSHIESIQATNTPINITEGIFIRAPIIKKIHSCDVQVLGKTKDGQIVALREGFCLGTTFHPELTDDFSWHHYFITMIEEKGSINIR